MIKVRRVGEDGEVKRTNKNKDEEITIKMR